MFVHGFGGDPWKAWLDFPTLLSAQPEVAEYDLFFFGYNWRKDAYQCSLGLREFLLSLAGAPASDIVNPSLPAGLRPRTAFEYKNIVVCAHSLGAIVSRLALLDAVDTAGVPLPWLAKVRLVLFAPAHSGAFLAEVLTLAFGGAPFIGRVLQGLAQSFFRSIRDLQPGSSTLTNLAAATEASLERGVNAECHRAWVLHAENDSVVVVQKFVQDQPAVQLANAGHMSVCKPTSNLQGPLEFLLTVVPQ